MPAEQRRGHAFAQRRDCLLRSVLGECDAGSRPFDEVQLAGFVGQLEGGDATKNVSEMVEGGIDECGRKAIQLLGQFDEEAVGIVIRKIADALVVVQKAVADVLRRLSILVPHPGEAIIEAVDLRQMLENGVVVAAVSDHQPHPAAPGVLKQGRQIPAVVGNLLFGVEQGKTVTLAVQMEHRLLRDVGRPEALGGGEVVDGRKFSDQRAGANDQRVKIRRQHAIDIAVLHQLGDGDVRPVDLRVVDLFGDKVAPEPVGQRRHERGIGFRLGPIVPVGPILFDEFDEAACQRDAGGEGAAGPDQQAARPPGALRLAKIGDNSFDGCVHGHALTERFRNLSGRWILWKSIDWQNARKEYAKRDPFRADARKIHRSARMDRLADVRAARVGWRYAPPARPARCASSAASAGPNTSSNCRRRAAASPSPVSTARSSACAAARRAMQP